MNNAKSARQVYLLEFSADRLVELFATQPAMFYIEGCGHKKYYK